MQTTLHQNHPEPRLVFRKPELEPRPEPEKTEPDPTIQKGRAQAEPKPAAETKARPEPVTLPFSDPPPHEVGGRATSDTGRNTLRLPG